MCKDPTHTILPLSCSSGIIGLGRKFRIMDDDGSKSLNKAEFNKAMKECKLDVNDSVSKKAPSCQH